MNQAKSNSYRKYSVLERQEILDILIQIDGAIIKAMCSHKIKDGYTNELISKIKTAFKALHNLGLLNETICLNDLLSLSGVDKKEYFSRFNLDYEGYDTLLSEYESSQLNAMPLTFLMNFGEIHDLSPRFCQEYLKELLGYGLNLNKAVKNNIEYLGDTLIITNTPLLDAMISNYMDLIPTLNSLGATFETLVEVKIHGEIKSIMAIEAAMLFFKTNQAYLSKEMQEYLGKKLEEINIEQERNSLELNIEPGKKLVNFQNIKI